MNYQSQKISNLNFVFEVKNFYSILGLYIFSLGSLVGGFSFYLYRYCRAKINNLEWTGFILVSNTIFCGNIFTIYTSRVPKHI